MTRPVVVLGGTNSDILASPESGELRRGTSNPGEVTIVPGGVGRNIAETVARLGVPVRLLSAVSAGPLGEAALDRTAAAGVDCSAVLRGGPGESGIYVAVHGGDGDLEVAVADMGVMSRCDRGYVEENREVIAGAAYLVIDANLPAETTERAVEIAAATGVPVLLEPVSVAKAARFSRLPGAIFAATPNREEVAPLLQGELLVENLLVTRGALGVGWWERDSRRCLLFPAKSEPRPRTNGAGDAFLAGVVAALYQGRRMVDAIAWGIGAAGLTVRTAETSYSGMSRDRLQEEINYANQGQG